MQHANPHMHMPSGRRLQGREGALGSGRPVADFGSQGGRRAWREKASLWLSFSQLHTVLLAAAWTGTGEATGSGISSGRASRPTRSLVRYAEPPWRGLPVPVPQGGTRLAFKEHYLRAPGFLGGGQAVPSGLGLN